MNLPYNGHIKVTESLSTVELKIPSDKNWFLVITLFPVILIWLLIEIFIVPQLIFSNVTGGSTFLFWICGWTFGGAFAIRMWLWHTIGKTKISVQNNILTIKKQNDLFSKQKHFELKKVQNIHIQNRDIERTQFIIRRNYLFSNKTKTVAFIYEHRTIRMVDWLDLIDATFVLDKLKTAIS